LISKKIEDLQLSSSNKPTQSLIADLIGDGITYVSLENNIPLSPDGQESVTGQALPGVVVEAAILQLLEDSLAKANDYLTLTNGGILLVIVLDLSYRGELLCPDLQVWTRLLHM
jgi:hypothetical protein